MERKLKFIRLIENNFIYSDLAETVMASVNMDIDFFFESFLNRVEKTLTEKAIKNSLDDIELWNDIHFSRNVEIVYAEDIGNAYLTLLFKGTPQGFVISHRDWLREKNLSPYLEIPADFQDFAKRRFSAKMASKKDTGANEYRAYKQLERTIGEKAAKKYLGELNDNLPYSVSSLLKKIETERSREMLSGSLQSLTNDEMRELFGDDAGRAFEVISDIELIAFDDYGFNDVRIFSEGDGDMAVELDISDPSTLYVNLKTIQNFTELKKRNSVHINLILKELIRGNLDHELGHVCIQRTLLEVSSRNYCQLMLELVDQYYIRMGDFTRDAPVLETMANMYRFWGSTPQGLAAQIYYHLLCRSDAMQFADFAVENELVEEQVRSFFGETYNWFLADNPQAEKLIRVVSAFIRKWFREIPFTPVKVEATHEEAVAKITKNSESRILLNLNQLGLPYIY